MNLIDVVIILFLLSSVIRGKEVGFVRQLFSTAGFFGGLFIGAALQPHTVKLVATPTAQSVITIVTTLGSAFLFLTIGEYIGIVLKNKFRKKELNLVDNILGSFLAFLTVLAGIWLSASIALSVPSPGIQSAIKGSAIVRALNRTFPPAPPIVASLSHLIDPNGFPQVFIGSEPAPSGNVPLPELGDLKPAVEAARASVVKIEGQGCGGIVEGSGFVAANGLVATNAHVVAGIKAPYILDGKGTHSATVIWFDPNLDFAVLRANDLAGKPLAISTAKIAAGTPGAVLGYPNGGGFTVKVAAVMDQFTATGRNIYDKGRTTRAIYEVKADIVHGNSGGPLVGKDGTVFGVVFAQSTAYQQVGYALTTSQVVNEINQAKASNHRVSTGSCTAD